MEAELSCFVAETPVRMASGEDRAIEQLNVGDWVLAYDLERGETIEAQVTETFSHPPKDALLRINGDLVATENHPFYANKGWVEAGRLKLGDTLWLFDQAGSALQPVMVESIERIDAPAPTYNIEVDGVHNYFANGVLVHNKPVCALLPPE